MSDVPTISVLMAVYNGAAYVGDAVQSILGQTFGDFEFILIDDGSTDQSPALMRSFAEKDSRIRLISRPNAGLTKSLNEGLKLARGEFVARMDGDDIALPQRFEKQLEYLRVHPECVCVGSRVTLIDPLGSPIRDTDHKLTHAEIDRDLLAGIGWSVVHPVAMIRRTALEAVDGYREQFRTSQDLDLFLRLAERGELANLPEVLLQYRQHFESVNFSKHEEQWRVKTTIVRDAYERRGLPIPQAWAFERRVVRPQAQQLQTWAWAALKRGNVPVARRHAIQSLRLAPFSSGAWRMMYCALRGR